MSRNRTLDQEHSAKDTTAVTESSTMDSQAGGQGFAERVGQRNASFAPDPFAIAADYLAGVQLFESKRKQNMAIKFGDGRTEDKPSQAVIDMVKEAGYRWNPVDRIWSHPVKPESAMTTRIEAERLYQGVRKMIRQEKGIDAGQEIAF